MRHTIVPFGGRWLSVGFWNYCGKFGESDEAGWDPDIGKLKKTRLPQKWDLNLSSG